MDKNIEILFFSQLVPKHMVNEVKAKSHNTMQDAAIELQWRIIEGIEENILKPITLYNIMPVFSFPKYYDDCRIKASTFDHCPGACDKNIGFLNVQYIKQLFPGNQIKKQMALWTKNNKDTKKVIISYTLHNAFLQTIKQVKKDNPNIVSCAIIADLPEYSDLSTNKNKLMKYYQKFSAKRARKMLPCIDCFVLLTKQMADYLKIDKPYIVMEGIATDRFGDIIEHNPNETTISIFYAGTLHQKFGIVNLLDAFSLIPYDNYRLIICGIGDSVETIKKRAVTDKRIQYLGQLPREEVFKRMQKATITVNPRQNNEIFTKYSFPSKNLESLSSGVPLVAYKLDGIPDEYDDYIEYVKGDLVDDLTNKLMEVCEMSSEDLYNKGNKAQNFVLSQKNARIQGEKIVKLIESLMV